MITVGAFEAKTKLSELLTRVEGGEDIVITRRGKAVARLTGASKGEGRTTGGTAGEANEFSAGAGRRSPDRPGPSLKDLLLADRPNADIPVPARGRLTRRRGPVPE
jgi:prevent-host-death family protein